jgi:dienelactone hydrolase
MKRPSTEIVRRHGTMHRIRAWTVVVLATMAGAACAPGTTERDAATTAPSPSASTPQPNVEVTTETFVDTSRSTDDAAGPQLGERTLVTRIAHPSSGGPYPLIVLSHGFGGHPDEFAETLPQWAADGFVVAAPAFPLTNEDAPNQEANLMDVANQPGDVSFVIDQVLAAGEDDTSPLEGLVDPEAIGVVGHSLGGATTWAVSFDTATRDPRIDSTVVFAGVVIAMPDGGLDFTSDLPLLVIHGDADDIPLDGDRDAYEQAASPKWFVTLHGGDHVPPYTDAESPYDDLVTRTVLDFWHGTLDGDQAALDRVTADATDPELTSVDHE